MSVMERHNIRKEFVKKCAEVMERNGYPSKDLQEQAIIDIGMNFMIIEKLDVISKKLD
ncbi:MAG: hypothetical protein K5785_01010 [Nitrosarchaeum sp.]|nr:hypothetical protein [Nitrosarchaeum sp.]